MSTTPRLFQPLKIGNLQLSHRVVLAPLTRIRATAPDSVPVTNLVKEYYSQRSKVAGSLLISEAVAVAAKAHGLPNFPGIWSEEQILAWKEIVDVVHANGSYIFLQIASTGRLANSFALAAMSPDPTKPYDVVGASPIPAKPTPGSIINANTIPRQLTIDEIDEYVDLYVQAAVNGVEEAGFDGIEIHAANGTLIDQFNQDMTNQRTDKYGGSVENRARFTLRIVDAIVDAIGAERTSIRFSPWSTASGMGMKDPVPQFSYLVSEIKKRHPNFAYIHLIEPRFGGGGEEQSFDYASNKFLRDIWAPLPLVSAGGYTRESAIQAGESGELVAFGRTFIANPDLPYRLKEGLELNPYDRSTFYVPGDAPGAERGYIDYPFSAQFKAEH